MKLLTVVGARPQFVKAAAISMCLRERPEFAGIESVLVHTGQHYDRRMSDIFFDELGIEAPKYSLGVAGGGHGDMTGRMMQALEPVLVAEKPDCLLIYGDTNSTAAAAMVAAKLCIPIAHVEAGLRSFNRAMPEEINRVVADHLSTHLYCPTEAAAANLAAEGLVKGVSNVGDVMYDVALRMAGDGADDPVQLERFGLRDEEYLLVTLHRAENTNDLDRLGEVLSALNDLSRATKVVFPIHPRTRGVIEKHGLDHLLQPLQMLEPVGFADMLRLERRAKCILTDSGGVQKEAYFYGVPCVTARDETEWIETVETGWNTIAGATRARIVEAVLAMRAPDSKPEVYGSGDSARAILEDLLAHYPG